MRHQTTVFSPARFFLLLLVFVTAAVLAGSLQDMLPPEQYILTDRTISLTGLSSLLPVPLDTHAAAVIGCTAGIAAEMLLWFAGGLTPYGAMIFYPAAAYRGFCFGLAFSLYTGTGVSALTGAGTMSLFGYIPVTCVLFLFASCMHPKHAPPRRPFSAGSLCRYSIRFLVCAGAVFWITVFCSGLPAVLF